MSRDDRQMQVPNIPPGNYILTRYARSFNELVLLANINIVNKIIDRNIIGPDICNLLQKICPSISLVNCMSGGYKHAILQEGWHWQTHDSYLELIDGNGAIQFSWYYGVPTYNS